MNEKAMRALLLFLIVWVALAAIVTYLVQRGPKSPRRDVRFDVPVYPGARNVQREGAPETKWLRVTYELDARPPATQVVQYYDEQLAARGWRLARRDGTQDWQTMRGEKAVDVFWRKWLTEDELLRFDLGLTYVRGTEAMPGQMTAAAAVTRNIPIAPLSKRGE